MSADTSFVKKQLVYWGQVTAAGAFTVQNGPALLAIGLAASVYTLTLGAQFTIPINRRQVVITAHPTAAAPGLIAGYDEAASAAGTVVVNGYNTAGAGAVANCAFQFAIFRIEMMP